MSRFYDMLKIPVEYDRDISPTKLMDISRKFLPASILGVSAGTYQRVLIDESVMIRTRGRAIDQKMAAVHGTLCMIPLCKNDQ
jgi:hypothetical protein